MADSSELGTSELDPITSPHGRERAPSPQRPFADDEGKKNHTVKLSS